jgi:hypothetical protein
MDKITEYLCICDYTMEDGRIGFLKGKIYYFDKNRFVKSEIADDHQMTTEPNFNAHFIQNTKNQKRNTSLLSDFIDACGEAKLEYEEAIKKTIDYAITSKEAESYWKEKFKIK